MSAFESCGVLGAVEITYILIMGLKNVLYACMVAFDPAVIQQWINIS